jgi:hypothetical protein
LAAERPHRNAKKKTGAAKGKVKSNRKDLKPVNLEPGDTILFQSGIEQPRPSQLYASFVTYIFSDLAYTITHLTSGV